MYVSGISVLFKETFQREQLGNFVFDSSMELEFVTMLTKPVICLSLSCVGLAPMTSALIRPCTNS